ncbi:hypothetical protein CDL12_03295 [Handroanthus impetiginosus]|uniref:Uncharacterized protein n=1 Tax=Handroanthus impetiginosus TaxID=429701 RepID=A0A2G9I2K2_9LAMI|nr:hypothetical protein CDL12_03295 [Handroanthus impetiginosus]
MYDEIYRGHQKLMMGKSVDVNDAENKEEMGLLVKNSFIQSTSCSEESSSIGKNSDISENSVEKADGDEEVQSSCKGALDGMEALEEVLPIRKGISKFYNGKSKSFASLADASSSSSSSIKDLCKPENAYTKRRRNLLACSLTWDKKNRISSPPRNDGGISKRVTYNSGPSMLALADLQQCVSVATAGTRSNQLVTKPC